MTAHTMRRKIDQLRGDLDTVRPRQPVHYKLVAGLRDGSSEAMRRAHRAELAALEAAGINAIVLVPMTRERVLSNRRAKA